MGSMLAFGGALVVLFLLNQTASLWVNYSRARRTGVPVILSPFSMYNPVWILTQAGLAPRSWFIPLMLCLPEPLSLFSRVIANDWPREHGPYLHRRLGPAFFVVSPGASMLSCIDTVANEDIISKYKAWPKVASMNDALNLMGKSIVGTDGDEWARHRRIVGPNFNERTSGSVWLEAARQAQAMLDTALQSPKQEQRTLCQDCRMIALHTFMAVGFGTPQEFGKGAREKGPGHELSFCEALVTVLHRIFLAMIMNQISPAVVPYLPKALREARASFLETRQYLDELLEQQDKAMADSRGSANSEQQPNFLTTLLRNARDEAEATTSAMNGRATGLSRSEMTGNMFMLTFAGHDTTAMSISVAIAQLAVHPQYQAWIREEVDQVLAAVGDQADYKHVFPKLKRCQALMLETLRLYHPTLTVPRVASLDREVKLSTGDPLLVPRGTLVQSNLAASYVSEDIWGPDCNEWKPDRFIIPAGTEKPGWPEYRPEPEGQTAEKLVAPPPAISSFWSLGPRGCLGIKFSQVEFVSAMFTLFSQAQVEAVPSSAVTRSYPPTEATLKARDELAAVIKNSGFGPTGPLLHILEPEKVVLRWNKR